AARQAKAPWNGPRVIVVADPLRSGTLRAPIEKAAGRENRAPIRFQFRRAAKFPDWCLMIRCRIFLGDPSTPKDPARMTKQSRMTKPEGMCQGQPRGLPFRPRQAFVLRPSGFVVCFAFTLLEMLIVISLLALL